MTDQRPYVEINRDAWTRANTEFTGAESRSKWQQEAITWGVWSVPESSLNMLPDVAGKDVVELGCGTGYFGAWLKKRGARRVLGIDVTPAQLATARQLNDEFQLGMEFIEANAEELPLPDGQFDVAVSEYGASIWCNPELWIPEAARVLRPSGELIFMRNSTLSMLCMPDSGKVTETLQRPMKALARMEWMDDDPGVEFHPPTGELIRLLHGNGFEIVDMVEVYAPDGAEDHPHYNYVPAAWASKWPAEEIWRVRRI
ncbi:MAG TPA: class I SAM-dependent methyltransferase [Candidatus Acidoferrales bacterium]|nr:class I SAM-dependent methyltransferase [Candidatus Acidoferrales bacterium]